MKRTVSFFLATIVLVLVVEAAPVELKVQLREARGSSQPVPVNSGYQVPPGQRDPFVRPGTARGRDCGFTPHEARGVRLGELTLRGVVNARGGQAALFEGGALNKGFALRVGDELCDGMIQAIHADTKTVVVRIPVESRLKAYRDVVLRF